MHLLTFCLTQNIFCTFQTYSTFGCRSMRAVEGIGSTALLPHDPLSWRWTGFLPALFSLQKRNTSRQVVQERRHATSDAHCAVPMETASKFRSSRRSRIKETLGKWISWKRRNWDEFGAGRVSDPHWFNVDPDTDPDPAFFLIADPDSGSGSRIRIPDPDPGFNDLKLKKIYN